MIHSERMDSFIPAALATQQDMSKNRERGKGGWPPWHLLLLNIFDIIITI